MRASLWLLGFGVSAFAGAAPAADTPASDQAQRDTPVVSPWQGRVLLGTRSNVAAALGDRALQPRPTAASVFGDYYFGPAWAGASQSGGLRATSGLTFGPRSSFGLGQAARATGASLSVGRSTLGPALALPGDRETVATVPYLGLGYTGWSARGGWAYSADLGLAGSNGLRLGRTQTSTANLDDAIRDLKMAPLVQVGVSYAF